MNTNLVCILLNLIYVACVPSDESGSVIITGEMTCGHGTGYCLLGNVCAVNESLVPDREGHCDGIRNAHYSCCRHIARKSIPEADEVATALLSSAQISDSLDVLNRASGVADINDVNVDHTENVVIDTTNANEQAADEHTSGINYLSTNAGDVDEQTPPVATLNARSRNLDSDAVEQTADSSSEVHSAREFFKIHRALFGDHVTNERNCTGHDHTSLFPLSMNVAPPELRGAAIKEKFDKNKCLNLTNQFEGADEGCINIWKFVSGNQLLCVGTLINSVWLLTSAACVTKIFNEGVQIDTIVVTDIEEKSGYYGISNMIVHENYMIEGISDMHDVGLVSLNQLANTSCFGCLPVEERKYADKSCTTYMMSGNRNRREFLGKCQDRLKILNMNSKMYLSLPCSTDEEHPFATDSHSANALWCENKLVGIETSYDQGYFVFTPINDYNEWITNNVQLYL